MDLNLLRHLVPKYDRPGPRYTSYPTAVQFSPGCDRDALTRAAASAGEPLSLYFHLPFCETLCWFCGCFTVITRDRDRAGRYLDLLEQEMALYCERRGSLPSVSQLHFGGGTPNFLEPGQIIRLGEAIHSRFRLLPDAEASVELAPRYLTRDHVAAFASIGIRRGSFGVQDIDPDVQAAIHRHQPHPLNRQTAAWLRAEGFQSVNIDLMYGLPHQTPQSFRKTLEAVLELEPDRIAVFNYAHVPWLRPAQLQLEKAGLPSPEAKLEILISLVDHLVHAGYEMIGLDHFARPGDELAQARSNGTLQRNFQGYSTRAGSAIAAFGVSAISQTPGSYHQNTKDLLAYGTELEAGRLPIDRGVLLTEDDRIRRHVIHRLMCDLRIDFATILEPFGLTWEETFPHAAEALVPFAEDGLVAIDRRGVTVSPLGRFFLRNLSMIFDAYLPATPGGTYSRTV